MKKSVAVFIAGLMLIIGLSAGFVFSSLLSSYELSLPTGQVFLGDSSSVRSESSSSTLLSVAVDVLSALQNENFSHLAGYVDPEVGVTFTPYSTVDFSTDLNFSVSQLKNAASDSTSYIWGVSPDTSEPIRLSIKDYFHSYVWDADYTNAAQIGVNQILHSGNAAENVEIAYEDCRYLDFYIPSTDESDQDWSSLKLVFHSSNGQWYLVGVIHSGWTP